MGGWDGSSRLSEVWRSTDEGASWTKAISHAGWSVRDRHAAVALPDGSIVLIGGLGSGRLNDVWRSMDQGASWTELTGSASWSGRYLHAAVALPGGPIVLMRGTEGRRTPSFGNDVWRTACQPGFRRGGASGVLCTPCPVGTLSSGGLHSEGCVPCPARTYGPDSGQSACPKCPLPGRCEVNGLCAEGASGPMCLECVPGYFPLADQCVQCSGASLALVIGPLTLLLIWALASCGVFTATAVAVAALFVSAAQLVALSLSLSLQAPAFVAYFAIVLRSLAADVGAPPLACQANLSLSASFWIILSIYALALAVAGWLCPLPRQCPCLQPRPRREGKERNAAALVPRQRSNLHSIPALQ